MKTIKVKFIILILALILVQVVSTTAVVAQDRANIPHSVKTTTASTCADVNANHYTVGATLYLRIESTDLITTPVQFGWQIYPTNDQSHPIASGTTGTTTDGSFCYSTGYQLQESDGGHPLQTEIWLIGGGPGTHKTDNFSLYTPPTPPPPTPVPATVSHDIDCLCSDGKSSHTITFTITGAVVSLFDSGDNLLGTFTESSISSSHAVEEGYYYTWVADANHTGASDGQITIGALDPCCEPPKDQPSFVTEDPWCEWTGTESIYHAEWTLTGALFSITGDGYSYGPAATSGKTTLVPGMYDWSWENDPAYADDGGGDTWDLTLGCEPGKGAIALNHTCNYVDGQSVNTVNLTVNNATLTFDGKDYLENATLKLSPGDYPWSWVGVNENETGSGLLTLGTCPPKTEEEKPDVAAGGLGPSFIASAAPALLTISGLGLAWVLIKNRVKKTN